MHYDFDNVVIRRGTNCMKWDEYGDSNTIPMWVADMDFETAPCIVEALRKRVAHGCFGYTLVPESFYEATIQWFKNRHRWSISRDSFIYTSGVVPAVSAIIKAMTVPGDKVLIQTPVYNCFFSSIRNNGCHVEENPLVCNRLKQNEGTSELFYTIDWSDFEKKCSDPDVKIFFLCNPHNPTGRVWTASELKRLGDICIKHNVFVVSDEIHCEFVMPTSRSVGAERIIGEKEICYTPFASLGEAYAEHCAVCVSPSKAFNIAGLQIANIIIADKGVRARVDRAINCNEVCDVNPFGVIALQTAYSSEGESWLDELNQYIYSNYQRAKEMIEAELPQCPVTTLEGTYLLWLDIRATKLTSEKLAAKIFREENVFITHGTLYGETHGEGFMRINIATRRLLMEEGLQKVIRCLKNMISV